MVKRFVLIFTCFRILSFKDRLKGNFMICFSFFHVNQVWSVLICRKYHVAVHRGVKAFMCFPTEVLWSWVVQAIKRLRRPWNSSKGDSVYVISPKKLAIFLLLCLCVHYFSFISKQWTLIVLGIVISYLIQSAWVK